MLKATLIPDAIEVIGKYELTGDKWIITSIGANNYDGYEKSPVALSYKGKAYGRTGWNSDTGHVYYCTRKAFATKFRQGT